MRARDLKALEFDKLLALLVPCAVSEPARRALSALQPATDEAEVRRRLGACDEMAALRSHTGQIPIGEFVDMRPLLVTAARESAILDGKSLLRVRDFVLASRHLAAFLRSRVEPFAQVAELAHDLVIPAELADELLRALADDGGLLDGASAELSRLRNRLRDGRIELEAQLLRQLNAPGMEPVVADHLVTIRSRRFVLPLRLNYSERIEGIVQDRSVSGETLFVEPMWAVGLNNRLMLLEREIEAEERRVYERLTAMVRGYVSELKLTFEAMVQLDRLNAAAIFAERYQSSRPQIVAEGVRLAAARHPLLVASGREVVPIELEIDQGKHGIVISGPNTGGKTAALKSLGLMALMAQAGLLIPAGSESHLPVFRSIFVDIGDEQSIETDLSTFSAHIKNLTEIARTLEEPALVILDEPGAGTDPAEGSALTIGLLDYLSTRRCIVAVATHSTAVKLHAYANPRFETAAVDFDAERQKPLFHLKPHTVGQSYGLAVAERLGLPAEIIAAAEAARPAGSGEIERALAHLEMQRSEWSRRLAKLNLREAENKAREAELTAAAEDSRKRRQAERERYRAEALSLLDDLRRDAAKLLHELKQQTRTGRALRDFDREAAARIEKTLDPGGMTGETAAAEKLKIGDLVAVGDIQGELVLLEPGKAVVAKGALRIEVAPQRLRSIARKSSRLPSPAVNVVAGSSGTAELNLIGMRVPEAMRRLESFLDHAYLSNQSEVRIIHGIGSGTLRKAVHELLGSSPYCAVLREAEPRSGGAGATVVEIAT